MGRLVSRSSFAVLFATLIGIGQSAFAADYPPADHAGADLILADGDVIWGVHTGIGMFQIPSGVEVTVRGYDGADADTGRAEIFAANIEIEGTLSAVGAGFSGGGGGGGESGTPGFGSYSGFAGTAYVLIVMDCGLMSSAVTQLAGSGAHGDGPGGQPGGPGKRLFTNFTCTGSSVFFQAFAGVPGRYGAGPDPNNDTTTDDSLQMGSGGSGGGGGSTTLSLGDIQFGGGAGGNGGGIIRLVPNDSFHLGAAGVLTADGAWGNLRSGADGGDALPVVEVFPGPDPDFATVGGAGSGGGICIDLRGLASPNDATFAPGAIVSSQGGKGGPATTSGGTVKVLTFGEPDTLADLTIEAGRILAPGFGITSAVAGWEGYD
jgi:hypothetical protein